MSTTTYLIPSRFPLPSPAVHYFCESWLTCQSEPSTRYTYRGRADSLLATEQLLSVIPLSVRQFLDVDILPERGWRGQVPAWFGIPCRIGRARLWLRTQAGSASHRDFSLLALLPEADLEDAPPLIYLGTQFLLEHQAKVILDCSSQDSRGQLLVP